MFDDVVAAAGLGAAILVPAHAQVVVARGRLRWGFCAADATDPARVAKLDDRAKLRRLALELGIL